MREALAMVDFALWHALPAFEGLLDDAHFPPCSAFGDQSSQGNFPSR